MKQNFKLILAALTAAGLATAVMAAAAGFPGGLPQTLGPNFRAARRIYLHPRHHPDNAVARWNEIALNATGLDHTPVAPGEHRVFGEQFGPTRASRAMAIVHIAMFDAANAIDPKYQSYTGIAPAPPGAAMDTAVAQAAHDTLGALYPSQKPSFDSLLAEELGHINRHGHGSKARGIAVGKLAAAAILTLRIGDGSEHPEPRMGVDFIPGNQPGQWRQDPISHSPIALGAEWSECKPFVIKTSDQFRAPIPPALTSSYYTAAYDEAKAVGGDGITTPTTRTPEQSQIGTSGPMTERPACARRRGCTTR